MAKKEKKIKFNARYYIKLIILILLIGFISYVYKLYMANILDSYVIFSIKDVTLDGAKGTLEINKVKIEDIDSAVDKLRDGSIYIAGLSAGARIVKSSSLPIGAKIGTTLGLGTASLVGYKVLQNSVKPNTHTGKMTASIDNINANMSASSNNKSNLISKLTDGSSDSNNDYNIISSLDIEQLQLIFFLNIILIYLLIIAIMFLLMKYISTLNLKFDFLLRLPYGDLIQKLTIKVLKWWGTTSSIWVYIILISVIIFLAVSAWGLYVVLSHIK